MWRIFYNSVFCTQNYKLQSGYQTTTVQRMGTGGLGVFGEGLSLFLKMWKALSVL